MSRFQTTGLGQDDFAEMVAEDVERALAHYDEAINQSTVVSVGKIAGSIASAVTLLSPKHQRAIDAIHADLPGLASKFVRALAAEAARRSEAGVTDMPRALPADETLAPPPRSDDLESMLIEDWAGRVAGSTYLEENLRIARSTLHRSAEARRRHRLAQGRPQARFPAGAVRRRQAGRRHKQRAVADRQSETCLAVADAPSGTARRPRSDRPAAAGPDRGGRRSGTGVRAGLKPAIATPSCEDEAWAMAVVAPFRSR
ncbi:hypothetical protein ACVINZ_004661 [Mesorhizobium jarvisii]